MRQRLQGKVGGEATLARQGKRQDDAIKGRGGVTLARQFQRWDNAWRGKCGGGAMLTWKVWRWDDAG